VSRPRELPPRPLAEPCVNVSVHTAPIIEPSKWLCRGLKLFPPQEVGHRPPREDVAPSLHRHYSGFHTTTSDSAPVPRVSIPARGGCHLSVSLPSVMTGSHVPWTSLGQGHAAYIPVAAYAVLRLPVDSSQRLDPPLVLTTSWRFSIRLQRFAYAHLLAPYLTQSLLRLFPPRSPPRLLTVAAGGGLKPPPERRLRGAYPHLLHSIARPSVRRS
jgi:hypothetical protein